MAGARLPRKKKAAPDAAGDLRRRAEEQYEARPEAPAPAPLEAAALLHELGVHQIELEMQNEELRRAQLELEAQRAKYFELFDLAPVGYLNLSDKGIVDDANFTAARQLGVERQQLVRQPFTAFVLAADQDAYYRHFEMLKRTGEPQTCEVRLRRAGARATAEAAPAHFWARLESRPQRAVGGETLSYRMTFSNVDAQVAAAEEIRRFNDVLEERVLARTSQLAESEQNFRAFFDAVEDIIVVAAPDGRLVSANSVASTKLGYSAAQITTLQVLDLYPAEKRGEAEAIFAAVLRGEPESSPLPLQSKSGALVPVETRVWLGRWDGAACVFGVSKDLTTEREALQKFERLFHGNPAAMALGSLPERRFTEVNEAFVNTLGYSREEVLGRTADEMNLFAEPEKQPEIAAPLQARGRVRDGLLKVKCKDGTILDGLFSGEIIESQGRQYYLSVMIDQTERKRAEEALRESDERQRLILEHGGVGVAYWSLDGRLLMLNRRAVQNLGGGDAEDFIGKSYTELFGDEAGASYLARILEVAASPEPLEFLDRADMPAGTRWYSSVHTRTLDAEGDVVGVHVYAHDVTDLKRAEEELWESQERLREAHRLAHIGVWQWAADTDTVTWTDELCRIAGRDPMLPAPTYAEHSGIYAPVSWSRLQTAVEKALETGEPYELELELIRPDGATRWVNAFGGAARDDQGRVEGLYGTIQDITEGKRAQEELARLNDELVVEAAALKEANATITRIAATDHLTGLANRRSFYQSLEKAVSLARRHGSPLSLVSFDLDGLKRVNDSAGHRAGDEVLASFAALLIDLCRAEDLPGRLGGDEFSVLLPGVELGGARGLAERLLAAVRSCTALEERSVTVSGGVAQWTSGDLPDDLLRRADEALYAAKRDGGDAAAG